MTLAGCQRQDEVTDVPKPAPSYVLADLALSLPASSASTRLSADVVQAEGQPFRGIQKLSIIPFTTQGKITGNDTPSYYESPSVVNTTNWTVVENVHHYQKMYLMHGVASFLTYGQATAASNDKSVNGSLIPKVDGQTQTNGIMPERVAVTPANLSFELEKIYKEETIPAGAAEIAAYLTYIAKAKGTIINEETEEETTVSWKDSEDGWLNMLYMNFTNQGNQESSIMAGSAKSVKAMINTLYSRMSAMNYEDGTIEKAIVNDILTRMTTYSGVTCEVEGDQKRVTSLGTYDNYPNNHGLLDGAAALRWDQEAVDAGTPGVPGAFVPQTVTTLEAPINTINRFAYPPELYYYGNSRIKASNKEVLSTQYESLTWDGVLANLYPYDDAVVSGNTQAVAIKEPLQYGVALLSAYVQSTTSNLPDADGNLVEVGASKFPVTGIIVCGQRPVDFEFKVKKTAGGILTGDELFVYDSHLNTNTGNTAFCLNTTEAGPFYTQVLQNEDDKDVTIMLELENKSDKNFRGEDGIIYKNTKFYLIGQVKLSQGDDSEVAETEKADVKKRVFTQDHTTQLKMKVQTLAHAYNVMPNILSGRLQIGVDIILNWRETKPTTLILTGEETNNGN